MSLRACDNRLKAPEPSWMTSAHQGNLRQASFPLVCHWWYQWSASLVSELLTPPSVLSANRHWRFGAHSSWTTSFVFGSARLGTFPGRLYFSIVLSNALSLDRCCSPSLNMSCQPALKIVQAHKWLTGGPHRALVDVFSEVPALSTKGLILSKGSASDSDLELCPPLSWAQPFCPSRGCGVCLCSDTLHLHCSLLARSHRLGWLAWPALTGWPSSIDSLESELHTPSDRVLLSLLPELRDRELENDSDRICRLFVLPCSLSRKRWASL